MSCSDELVRAYFAHGASSELASFHVLGKAAQGGTPRRPTAEHLHPFDL